MTNIRIIKTCPLNLGFLEDNLEINQSKTPGLCGLDGKPTSVAAALNSLTGADSATEAMSHARRDYLAEIYRLQSSTEEPVTTTAVAARLEVSPPAAVKMMRLLAHEGYLRRQPYKGVRLTPKGEREALRSIRRHRLLEAFLVTVMKFGWDEVHTHAHDLEAAINDQFEDRMDELAGYPARCPHGDPIPTKDGRMPAFSEASLLTFPVGTRGILRRIRRHTPDKLRYLAEIRLTPGTPITLLNRAPFDGPVRLKTPVGEQVLGADMAANLFIEVAT